MRIDPHYLSKQKELTEKARFILLDWVIQVARSLKISNNVIVFGIEILDLYCSVDLTVKFTEYQALGSTCMALADNTISSSVHEPVVWRKLSDNYVQTSEMTEWLKKILSSLNFQILGSLGLQWFKKEISEDVFFAFICTIFNYENLRYFPNKNTLLSLCEQGLLEPRDPKVFKFKHSIKNSGYIEKQLAKRPQVQTFLSELKGTPDLCVSEIKETSITPTPYTLLCKLGEGSYSKVYKCTDEKGNKFALKKFDCDDWACWVREILISKTLKELPFVLSFHDVMLDPPALVFPLFEEDLDSYLYNNETPEIKLKEIVWMITSGLKGLHDRNIIWRDLKPSNILITETPRLKLALTDFGLSLCPTDTMGKHVCSYSYRPPEVFFKIGGCGAHIDVWGLGVTFYKMVFGELMVFDQDGDVVEALKQIAGALEVIWSDLVLPGCEKRTELCKEANRLLKEGEKDETLRELLDESDLDEEGRDLMFKMLEINPEKRITVDEVLRHPWFNDLDKESLSK